MIIHFMIDGDPASVGFLGEILAPEGPTPLAAHEFGWLLTMELDGTERVSQVADDFRSFLDLVSGTMRLFANSRDRLTLKGINYTDPATGRFRGIRFDFYGVAAAFEPDALRRPTAAGVPLGAAAVVLASRDPSVARALSILSGGASDWWELYILLEVLRDSLGGRPDRTSGSWEVAFQILRERYGQSRTRLEELKQTINHYRHAGHALPATPWELADASKFIKHAIKDWLNERLDPPERKAE